MVDAFADLAKRLPELRLTVAGCICTAQQIHADFPAELRARVDVVPFVSRGQMPEVYASHDILVLPSLIEGMPLTLLEAMAAAMPVVTTNTCGMADIVENRFNGLLVTPADASALSSAIQEMCESSELRCKFGTMAQETARRYTWAAIARQLEHIFRIALESTS